MAALAFKAIERNIMAKAREALLEALEETANDAKEHAPVRDVFRGGNRPRENAQLRSERGLKKLRHSVERQAEFLEMAKSQTMKSRRYNLVADNDRGFFREEGNSRMWNPIARDAAGVPRRVGRRRTRDDPFAPQTARDISGYRLMKQAGIQLPDVQQRGPVELREPDDPFGPRPAQRKQPSILTAPVTSLLNRRGNAELTRQTKIARQSKAGLAGTQKPEGPYTSLVNSAFHVPRPGVTTFGGRLRDEIYTTDVRDTGKTLVGWVVSPTYYAKYQEYGTAHNRAHPYMRPALYRMRGRFPNIVKRWMRSSVV